METNFTKDELEDILRLIFQEGNTVMNIDIETAITRILLLYEQSKKPNQ